MKYTYLKKSLPRRARTNTCIYTCKLLESALLLTGPNVCLCSVNVCFWIYKKNKKKCHSVCKRYWMHLQSRKCLSYSKTCVKWPLSKRQKIVFQDQLSLNAGQKYCRMLPLEHSAILSTFIKLPFVIKIFVLSILGWPFYTGFTVFEKVL